MHPETPTSVDFLKAAEAAAPSFKVEVDRGQKSPRAQPALRVRLREIAPHVAQIGFLMHPETPTSVDFLKAAEAAAPSFKVEVTALGVHNADEIARAVGAFAGEPGRGLIVFACDATRELAQRVGDHGLLIEEA